MHLQGYLIDASLFLHHADTDPCLEQPPASLAQPSNPIYDPVFPLTDHEQLHP
jgi:hypothetical protein